MTVANRSLFAATLLACLLVPLATFAQVRPSDRAALIALYNSTNGPEWTNHTNWLGPEGTECTWHGVLCATREYGYVFWLRLPDNNLQGSIPPEIAGLSDIGYLELGGNKLTGPIPDSIGSLSKLYDLSLRLNQLSGPIPDSLAALSKMQWFDLSYNQLSGHVPGWFSSFPELQGIVLSGNHLDGGIPPELGSVAQLGALFLDQNALTGEIPSSLANLTLIPGPFGNPALYWLDLSFNGLYASDAAAREWLESRRPGCLATQTVAPANFAVQSVASTSAALQWTPIEFSSGPGRYEIRGESAGAPVVTASTLDKSAATISVPGLQPGRTYAFTIRTVSEPHPGNPYNVVASDPAGPVSATTPVEPPPSVSVSDARVVEGDGAGVFASFVVTLSRASGVTASVLYTSVNGSAEAGLDYVAASSRISFLPGETTKSVLVEILGDSIDEGDETFTLALSDAANATLGDANGRCTILDDDTPLPPVPDPVIVVDGCTRVGGACTLAARSASGSPTATWSYNWLMNGASAARSATWSPHIAQAGSYPVTLTVTNVSGSGSASANLRLEAESTCPHGQLCALDGRFQLSLTARDHRTGATGPGLATPQNDFSGYFSIPSLTSDDTNPEVFVKLLDGRAVNGHFWVFYGGLTDLEYTLTVKDVVAATEATYTKEGGSSRGGFDVGSGVAQEACEGEVDGVVRGVEAPSTCEAADDRLCLAASRFRITLAARDQRTGVTVAGMSIPGSDRFGYFSLPGLTGDAANPEVFVKLLDGRPINGRFWLFFAGLTDFGYTLSVTDTVTGISKEYVKAPGSACGAFDSNAF